MSLHQKPILGITMGDPCGIGPEIAVKACAEASVYERCRPLIIGNADVIRAAVAITDAPLVVHAVSSVTQARFTYGTLDVLHQDSFDVQALQRGAVSAAGGKAAYLAVEKAIQLALEHAIDATVTGPLNKEALHMAGYKYSGHTEIYGHLTQTKDYCMMLADDNLRVVHVSTHVSLREACDRCRKDRIVRVVRLAHQACRQLGIEAPRIAVAGLNPHAGENGLFGQEEIQEITPAIAEARAEGIDASGPHPPDTLFSKANGGLFDIVVAQYHDQGHIPLKTLGFRYDRQAGEWSQVSGVNITLGLPIIRTSVDHGTAFDLAGTGKATAESLLHAIDYAIALAGV